MHMMAMKALQARRYAMAMILVRLPKAMECLAAAAPRTDQALSMDCYRCPCADHAATIAVQQQKMTPDRGNAGVILGWTHVGRNVHVQFHKLNKTNLPLRTSILSYSYRGRTSERGDF
jgi:hypothetical protein